MTLTISYDPFQSNWYVGELYKYFHTYLINKNIKVFYTPIKDLAKKLNETSDWNNRYPSLFNIYNLIVTNNTSGKTFLHSLSDYAPFLLEHQSALDKLNIKAFAFCSNHTDTIIVKYNYLNINLIPSFYILENWNDHEYIRINKHNIKKNNCYFNGLGYGHRELYINYLKTNSFFTMKDKRNPNDYLSKPLYYENVSKYRYGLSLNGAAEICYRDVEYFGLGVLCIREPLSIKTKDNLEPNIHYKSILDDFVTSNIFNPEKINEIIEYIIDSINNITIEESEYILNNAKKWYENNAMPDKQVDFLYQCLIENDII